MKKALLFILCLAFILRFAIFFLGLPSENDKGPLKYMWGPDSIGYDKQAVNILKYGKFSEDDSAPFSPEIRRTPLYPAFLAAIYGIFGHHPPVAIFFHILISASIVLLTYKMAQLLSLPQSVSLLAAFFIALEPVSIIFSNSLLTESLFSLLHLVAIYFLIAYLKKRTALIYLIISALFNGLATLCRPINAYFFIIPVVAIIIFSRNNMKRYLYHIFIFLLITSLLIFPWLIRNYIQAKYFTLSSIRDYNLLHYNAAYIYSYLDKIDRPEAASRLMNEVNEIIEGSQLSEAEKSAIYRKVAFKHIFKHPVVYAWVHIKGIALIYSRTGSSVYMAFLEREGSNIFAQAIFKLPLRELASLLLIGRTKFQTTMMLIFAFYLLLIYLMMLFGIRFLFKNREWFILALLTAIISYFSFLSSPVGDGRFRICFFPYISIISSVGIISIYEKIKKRSSAKGNSRKELSP